MPTPQTKLKKYDSKAAVVGTPKAYNTAEDMVVVKEVGAKLSAIFHTRTHVRRVCGCAGASTWPVKADRTRGPWSVVSGGSGQSCMLVHVGA